MTILARLLIVFIVTCAAGTDYEPDCGDREVAVVLQCFVLCHGYPPKTSTLVEGSPCTDSLGRPGTCIPYQDHTICQIYQLQEQDEDDPLQQNYESAEYISSRDSTSHEHQKAHVTRRGVEDYIPRTIRDFYHRLVGRFASFQPPNALRRPAHRASSPSPKIRASRTKPNS